jgi:hypothetical protein
VLAGALVLLGTGFSAEPVEPERWAESLCSSIGRWSADLAEAKAIADLDAPELAVQKEELVGYLGEVTAATRRLLRQLKRTGSPGIDDGDQVASTFRRSLVQARDGFADALDRAEDLDADRPRAFAREREEIGARVAEGAAAVARTFATADQRYDDEALEAAFANAPSCAGVT